MEQENEFSFFWWEIANSVYNNKQLVKYINENKDEFTSYEWLIVSKSPFLDLSLIEAFKEKLDWQYMSAFRKFEEKELKKYADYLDWLSVSRFQNLSMRFIKEYEDQLSFEELIKNEFLLETSVLAKIIAMYNERKDNPKYKKIWDENRRRNTLFTPSKGLNIKVVEDKIYSDEELNAMSKDELKKILSDKNIRTYYHDTLDILKNKIIELQRG
jgi:hypothetical protein